MRKTYPIHLSSVERLPLPETNYERPTRDDPPCYPPAVIDRQQMFHRFHWSDTGALVYPQCEWVRYGNHTAEHYKL